MTVQVNPDNANTKEYTIEVKEGSDVATLRLNSDGSYTLVGKKAGTIKVQAKAKDNDILSEVVEFTVKEKPAADLSTVKANIVDYGPYSHRSGDTLTLNANGTGLMEFYRDNTYTFNWDIEAKTDGTYKLILSNLNCTVSGGYYKLTRNYGSGVISANLKTIALTYYDGYEGAIENLTAENYQ